MYSSDVKIKPKRKSALRFGTKVIASRDCIYVARTMKAGTKKLADLAYRLMPHFRKELDLPKNVTIRLAKTKKWANNGVWYEGDKTATLDPRRPVKNVLNTLSHELIHAKQYHTGQLSKGDRHTLFYNIWEGEVVKSRGATYKSYRNLPWEKEAFGRSSEVLFKTIIRAYKAGDLKLEAVANYVGWGYICRNEPEIADEIKIATDGRKE